MSEEHILSEEAIFDEIHDALHHEIEATNSPDFSGEVTMKLRIDNGRIQSGSVCRETQLPFKRRKQTE